MANLIDFSNIKNQVNLIKDIEEYWLSNTWAAFWFYSLEKILWINDYEILNSLTDWSWDRWIDAVYIEEDEDSQWKFNIHLFQFKYKESYDKVNNYFESNETNKVLNFLKQIILDNNRNLLNTNSQLSDKISDIFEIIDKSNLGTIFVHFCSNLNNCLVESEKINFEKALKSDFNMVETKYHTINDVVSYTHKKPWVDWEIQIIWKNFFDTKDWNISGLICQVDARELIEAIKEKNKWTINNNIFHDNVRVYLWNSKKKSINEKIKETTLDEDNNFKFFYYNNWITITCSDLSYQKGPNNPIVKMKDFQIVNWQQTIKTLFDVYKTQSGSENFNILLLVRIYETKWDDSFEVSQKIAEYTNSQNPVKLRDIRSNDEIQKKYSESLKLFGYFYENKKYLHIDKPNNLRIDAELLGQIILSFYELKPWEASNKKSLIYWDEYNNIFSHNRVAQELLLPYLLFRSIEERKQLFKKHFNNWEKLDFTFVKYATFTILYYIWIKTQNEIKLLTNLNTLDLIIRKSEDFIDKYYDEAVNSIKGIVEKEKIKEWDDYTHNNFFKNNVFKKNIEWIK